MNTYMRQSSLAPSSQIHDNFAKDKEAWENAIALYQGPDPLDNWWNYICWYENNSNSDRDNKFRETLERCLTQYEHTDFYKHDIRMVQLWLKYIEMQNNPLHFYQVLHQRGVGTQIASFYISWATYYESLQAYKEVEAVYNLAFQEKAQPYADLHHAHSKFLYTKSLAANSVPHQHAAAVSPSAPNHYHHHHHQHQHQHPLQHQQQPHAELSNQNHLQHNTHIHAHLHATPHNSDYRQHMSYQTYEGMTGTLPAANMHHDEHLHYQSAYNHHHSSQEYHQQQQQQQQQQPPLEHSQCHPQHSQQATENYHSGDQYQRVSNEPQDCDLANSHHELEHKTETEATIREEEPKSELSPEKCEPLADKQQTVNEVQLKNSSPTISHNSINEDTALAAMVTTVNNTASEDCNNSPTVDGSGLLPNIEVTGVCLPRRFATHSQNSSETWQPALFLEEPADPQRVCHYAKTIVYPPTTGMEYSPEEIKARRYKYHPPASLKMQMAEMINNSINRNSISQLYQQQQTKCSKESQKQSNFESLSSFVCGQLKGDLQKGGGVESYIVTKDKVNAPSCDGTIESSVVNAGDKKVVEFEDNSARNSNDLDIQQTSKAQNLLDETLTCNAAETAEEQVVASTNRLNSTDRAQNKTIKIKFKKDRSIDGSEVSNAYKIERIYQPETDSPFVAGLEKRNSGYNGFHPYLSTSTPKNITKRQKSKVKHVHTNKRAQLNNSRASTVTATSTDFVLTNGGNSNSSSGENANISAVLATVPKQTQNSNLLQNANFNDNANCAFSSMAVLENSNCSLSTAVDRLNFQDIPALNNNTTTTTTTTTPIHSESAASGRRASVNNTASNDLSLSTFQENSYFSTQHDVSAREKRLEKALQTIERHMAKESVDPFNSELCRAFLTKLNFPGVNEPTMQACYKIVQTPLPKIANTRQLNPCPGVQFNIDKEIGRGSYGSVYKATDSSNGSVMALKFQKPANTWEIYICDQVLKRIKSSNILPGLMTISSAIIAPNASLIATEFSPYGSLLDINNKLRQATTKVMHESLVMHFSAQICDIIHHLHASHIIHADIKPDNFLLMRVPSTALPYPSLRLIDFGCAIDMSLFPEGNKTKFRKVIQTDGFTCIEMLEGRTWSYETDLFCIAGTVHVMLFGEYMQLQKRGNAWDIKQKLPRYLKKQIWTQFFGQLLNIKANGERMPDLSEMRQTFEEESLKMESELQKQIRTLSNILHRR